MAQASQADSPSPKVILEAQLRESFGRVVYSHKTHEKCADILLNRLSAIKLAQIVLSSLTTVSFFVVIFGSTSLGAVFGVLVSAILLMLSTYTKNYDLGEIAQKHRHTALELWIVREEFLSLLTDLNIGKYSLESLLSRRDNLTKQLHVAYEGAPSTNASAYSKAQKALKLNEDLTFNDEEINHFLPKELHRTPAA